MRISDWNSDVCSSDLQGTDQPAAGSAADGPTAEGPTAEGPTGGEVPGNVLGSEPDSDFWRAIRRGETGYVSIPNAAAGRLIQSEGDNWRAVRNGPVTVRSEEHTSELQSLMRISYAVFCLKTKQKINDTTKH